MRTKLVLIAVTGLGGLMATAPQSAAAAAAATTVTCTGTYSGTATNLVVPAGALCILDGATITHNVTVRTDAGLAAENTTIGNDLLANQAGEILTGWGGGNPGPVHVGHDLLITGADPSTSSLNDNGYDICDTTVGHNLAITRTAPNFEIDLGDTGAQEFCSGAVSPADTIRNDLVVTGNKAGRIDIGNNSIREDLTVRANTATTATGDTGDIDVSDNHVGDEATCTNNSPALSRDGQEDGPNVAEHNTGCG
jgi:hypothetical protein